MKKIVIDARELRTTTGRYVERLLHYLQKIDHDHQYIVLLTPRDFDSWDVTEPNFTKVVCPYKEFTFGEQLGFWRQLNNLNADLVHFPMAQQPVLYRGKTVTAILDLTTFRFINPAKNKLIFIFKRGVYKWLVKYVSRKSSKIITISNYVKDDVSSFSKVSKAKISVVYPAADKITEAPVVNGALVNENFLMYIGRPLPHKNLQRLIEAFVILQAQHKGLQLVLAGKKDTHYLRFENYIKANAITNVLFTDFVSEGQLRWLYENASGYVFPSLSEGFGLPGLEAMAHGAPVISSKATCLPEIYGEAAHYFNPMDVNDMAAKINEVLVDEGLRHELIERGYKQVKKYSWQKMAEETLAVYNKAL